MTKTQAVDKIGGLEDHPMSKPPLRIAHIVAFGLGFFSALVLMVLAGGWVARL